MFDSELSIQARTARTWVLTAPLVWTGTQGDTFCVPPGFVTDFATVPRVLHWLVSPYGAYTRAAVLHDWLIETMINYPDRSLRVSSRDVDGIFRRVMHDLGVAWSTRWLMWAAVRAASLGNPRRAYGRQFGKDAAKVVGIGLIAIPITLTGVVGVIISLTLARVLSPFPARRVEQRPAGQTLRES